MTTLKFSSVLLDRLGTELSLTELIENHFVSPLLKGRGLSEIQRDGNQRIGAKVKTWGEEWGLFLFLVCTVEPRCNEVLGITNDIFCPSYSIMFGKEPRYNQTSL